MRKRRQELSLQLLDMRFEVISRLDEVTTDCELYGGRGKGVRFNLVNLAKVSTGCELLSKLMWTLFLDLRLYNDFLGKCDLIWLT